MDQKALETIGSETSQWGVSVELVGESAVITDGAGNGIATVEQVGDLFAVRMVWGVCLGCLSEGEGPLALVERDDLALEVSMSLNAIEWE